MKRIVIIAKCYKRDISGPANIIRGLIRQFDKDGINYKALLLEEGIYKVSYLKQIVQELRKKDKTIVNIHTDGFILPLFIMLMSKIYRKHSYYLTVHGIYRIDKGKNSNWKYLILEKYIYKHFSNIICVSDMLKDDLKKIYKREKNVYVIPNATDANSNKVFKEKSVKEIVSLGGLRTRKGIKAIMACAKEMKKTNIPFHISLYGEDENNWNSFVEQIRKDNLKDQVEYFGNLMDKQKVYDIVRSADVQFCFSVYDTFNVAVAESLVLGCPCISSDRCGASTLIQNNFNGLVVNIAEEYNNHFEKVIEFIRKLDKEKREIIEQKAKDYKEIFSWKNIAKKYAELE